MLTYPFDVAETTALLATRLTVGDRFCYEARENMSPKTLSALARRHPNQTRGIIASWQNDRT